MVAHMMDLHAVELDNVWMEDLLEEGNLIHNGLNSTAVLLLNGNLVERQRFTNSTITDWLRRGKVW